jgi:hypothetical protein
MSVYPPLKFVEQMENYITLYNARSQESLINNLSMKYADEFISKNRNKIYHDFGELRQFGDSSKNKEIVDFYTRATTGYCLSLGVQNGMDSINDFVDLMIFYDARRLWRKNKLSYLVDNALFETLMTMETPKLAPVDCLTKLPANCFYIDYNGMGSELMEDLDGSFVLTDESDEELNIILLHLIHGKNNKELFVTTVHRLPLNGAEKFIPNGDSTAKSTFVCEDGVERTMRDGILAKFVYNFLIYFHAANRDVEISERTRQNHEKVQKTIKNKFREVKEFEVGFTYGRSISKDAKRIKYVGKADANGVSHSPKSSHYRSAHWHHYWVGSGEDKKLIIKWVEGVFVNGGKEEAENIQVHKVK